MAHPQRIPPVLRADVLPFDWDVRRVWALDAPVVLRPRRDFDRLLELPLWSSVPGRGLLFDISPAEVLRDPARWPHQSARLARADLRHPLDVLVLDGRSWVLDGVHRLARHFARGSEWVEVRHHGVAVLPEIRIE